MTVESAAKRIKTSIISYETLLEEKVTKEKALNGISKGLE
jgi:hypothetical protein